jgi:hypothetical protein
MLAAILLACVIPAFAGNITVQNSSFEDPTGLIQCGGGFGVGNCTFSAGAPTSWLSNSPSTYAGTFQPGMVPNVAYNNLVGSPSIAFINGPGPAAGGLNPTTGGTFQQTVGTSILGTYTLTLDMGFRKDNTSFVSEADLIVGSNVIKALGSNPVQGGWSTFTATYTALTAGQAISIQLRNIGVNGGINGQANFDNVSLNGPVGVPEPSTIAITAMGLGMLGLRFRRKRSI